MRKTKAIYLHLPLADMIWRNDLMEVVGDRHDLIEYDPSMPLEPQFGNPQRCKKIRRSGVGLNRCERLQQAVLDPSVRTDGQG